MNMFAEAIRHRHTKELLKELNNLSASEEVAERAAQEMKRLEEAFEAQRTAAVELARQRDFLVQSLLELKADIYRCERGGLEEDIDYALANMTHNAPHEGPGAASSRTVPLDAVVSRLEEK